MPEISNSIPSKMNKQISENYKMLLSNIKHDLTNPINAILGYAELMMDYLKDGKEEQFITDVNKIHESGTLLYEKINTYFTNKKEEDHEYIRDIIEIPELQFAIRTPISTILGLTELLREDAFENSSEHKEDFNDFLGKIYLSGKSIINQTNELSMYANSTVEEFLNNYKSELYINDLSLKLNNNIENIEFPFKKGDILIIDDDKSNLELLDKIISQSLHNTHCAYSARGALDILQDKKINIDIILLDLIMPEINGLELLKTIKTENTLQHIPVIMLSGMDDLEATAECISNGADDFLFKPISKVLLNARIKNSLEKKFFHDKEIKYQEQIKIEQEKSDKLLLNILPKSIAERLKNGESLIADDFEDSTVLFADLAGFTKLSSSISATDVVMQLNSIFSLFDSLLIRYSLEKIKTIGDCYMLAGGVPEPDSNHADSVARMALEMLNTIDQINTKTNQSLKVRIGINSGPVSAGVIGKEKFIYDLWGDTVNVASRMETYGENDKIHVTHNTYLILKGQYSFSKRKKMDIPGKGEMETYFLNGKI
ncbi:MAG: response regulator [Candidatus Marinimicrobia bacterium]|nr:response regulator [Candidatus Neomarinimicrobiota bacterium]